MIISSLSSISLVILFIFVCRLGGCDTRILCIGSSLEATSLKQSGLSTAECVACRVREAPFLVDCSGASLMLSTLLFLFVVALSDLEFVIVV